MIGWAGLVNELYKLVENFGLARFAAIVGVSLGVAATMALIIARIGSPPRSVLYADISYADAQPILDDLQQRGLDHSLRDQGARVSILVPRDQVSQARLSLAANGITPADGVGYEIFDDNQTLGVTSFQQNINRLRALEGELARTLSTMTGIRTARVHLVMPERELFSQSRNSASASIMVDAPTGLSSQAVQAIVNLAASAVPGLEPSKISILDSRGVLLAASTDNDNEAVVTGAMEEKKAAARAKIRREVEDLVARIVGPENVRVEVAAEMDFSRITESAEIVDPDSQTVLSSTTIEETSNNVDPAAGQGVSVGNGLPGAQPSSNSGPVSTASNNRIEETTNYEISKTVRNAVREEGLIIKRLSVAVAINGAQPQSNTDASAFAPRSEEELERIETLVKSAIGFSLERGDQVSVVDIPFTSVETPVAAPITAPPPVSNPVNTIRAMEIGALTLIALALGFFVLRPLMKPAANAANALTTATPARLEPASPSATTSITQNSSPIDLAAISGDLGETSAKKVSEIVKAHTDESADILRNWMREAS